MNQAANRPDALPIVPILWRSAEWLTLPEAARKIQLFPFDISEIYRHEGLYALMRLKKFRLIYQEAMFRLAQAIAVAAKHPPPELDEPIVLGP